MKYKNILVTGGAGFIGSNVALKLKSQGYNVTVVDALTKQIYGENPENSSLYKSIKDKIEFVQGSVTDRDLMEKLLSKTDCVIHLAEIFC